MINRFTFVILLEVLFLNISKRYATHQLSSSCILSFLGAFMSIVTVCMFSLFALNIVVGSINGKIFKTSLNPVFREEDD